MKRRSRPIAKSAAQGESFLFESVEGGEHIGRYSFVGCNPRAVIRQTGNRVEVIENGKVVERFAIGRNALPRVQADQQVSPTVRDGLEVVERVMKKYRAVAVPGLPRFTGGAIGFIGYEFIHDVEPVVPRPPQDELKTPVMYFLIADQLLIFDRVAADHHDSGQRHSRRRGKSGRRLRKCHERN